jgi:hypothetical protein
VTDSDSKTVNPVQTKVTVLHDSETDDESSYERFEKLATAIVLVPKDEIDAERQKD